MVIGTDCIDSCKFNYIYIPYDHDDPASMFFRQKQKHRRVIPSRTNIPPAEVLEMCFLLLNHLIDNYQEFGLSVFLY